MTSPLLYPPLAWPDYWLNPTGLQSLLKGVPFVGIDRKAHLDISDQLRSRPDDVLKLWPENLRARAAEVGAIAKDYLRWPNARFIPEDPCGIVFWDPTMEMRLEEAILVLIDDYGLPEDTTDYIGRITMGELVSRCWRRSETGARIRGRGAG